MTSTIATITEKLKAFVNFNFITSKPAAVAPEERIPSFTDRLNAIGYFTLSPSLPTCFIDHITLNFMNEPIMIDQFPHHIIDASLLNALLNKTTPGNLYPHVDLSTIKPADTFNEMETLAKIQALKISLLVLKNAAETPPELIAEHEKHLSQLCIELKKIHYQSLFKKYIASFVERLEKISSLKKQLSELASQYEKSLEDIKNMLIEEEIPNSQMTAMIAEQREQQKDNLYTDKMALLIELKDQLNKHIKETGKTIDLFAPYYEMDEKQIAAEKKAVLMFDSMSLLETETQMSAMLPKSTTSLADIAKACVTRFTSPTHHTVHSGSFGLFGAVRASGCLPRLHSVQSMLDAMKPK